MKCQEAQQLINEYIDQVILEYPVSDQQLAPDQLESLRQHFNQCAQCAEKLHQEQQFRQLLRHLNTKAPVPAPTKGFVDRALRNTVMQHVNVHRNSHRQGFVKGFGSALAAGLALWVVVSLFPIKGTSLLNPSAKSSSNAITIALRKPTNVKLAFHSLKDVPNATIRIILSDNLELVGYQNRQTLEWKTNLMSGDNVLTLPIKALKLHQGKIIAQVGRNHLYKSIEFILDVKNNDKNKPGISENKNIITPAV
jgi:uncharacterized membrane-anchored protein YhcB (DUF1043 family)